MRRLRGLLAAIVAIGIGLAVAPEHAALAKGPVKAAAPARTKTKADKSSKSAKTKPKKVASKKKAPPAPLDGTTVDYAYDGKDIGHTERAWLGRAFVHKKAAADPEKALPLLVFVHGLNTELIKYRWFGGGNEGDVRRVVQELIEAGQIPPMIVAAPSTVTPQNAVVAATSWMGFDLDHFVAKTEEALKGKAKIDKTKILVAGHSGGGCNIKGGIATALKAKNLHAVLSIDTCMGTDLATALAQTKKATNVVVTWQAITWQTRPLKDFRTVFEREVKKSPADAGVLRTLDFMTPTIPSPHDAMVSLTLKKYLPLLLPVPAASSATNANGASTSGATNAPGSANASGAGASSATPATSVAPATPSVVPSSAPPASTSAPVAPPAKK
ncbi:MAG: hypothetical protein U0441_15400 [Polyangiaceae bacterium]